MNLPNALSIIRFVITFFFIIEVNRGEYRIGLYLFVLQAFTDLLDGFLARTMGSKTRLGAFLDPAADKTMLLAAYIMLYLKNIVPGWLLAVLLARDLILVIGFAFLYRLSVQDKPEPSIWGKTTTALQIFTVVYLLWSGSRDYALYFYAATALFTGISGVHYAARALCVVLKKA